MDNIGSSQFSVKYRPKTLKEFVGQPAATAYMLGLVKANKIPGCILISGPSGIGKCVSGDTLLLTDGGFVKIENLVEDIGYNLLTDPPTLVNRQGFYEQPSHSYKKKADVVETTFRSGLSIKTTKNHPVLCLSGSGYIKWIKTEDIRNGDCVIIPRTEVFPKRNVIVNYKHILSRFHPYMSTYNYPKIIDKNVATFLGLFVAEGSTSATHVLGFTNHSLQIRRLYRSLLRSWDSKIELFNAKPHFVDGIKKWGGIKARKSAALVGYLKHLGVIFGHCRNAEVPWCILQSPKSVQAAFLRAYFEGDGYIDKKGNISASSASKELIRQLQVIFINFGIVAKVTTKPINGRDYWSIHLHGKNCDIFMEEIGFISERKNSRYACKHRNTNVDITPESLRRRIRCLKRKYMNFNGGYYSKHGYIRARFPYDSLKTSMSQLFAWCEKHGEVFSLISEECADFTNMVKYLAINKCFLDPYVFSESLGSSWVYDFTLPKTHSFIGGGIINHNTTFARLAAAKFSGWKGDPDKNPDAVELSANVDSGKQDVKDAIEIGRYSPKGGKRRCMIVDEVQGYAGPAASTLLKAVEDVSPKTTWLLCTDRPEKLPRQLAMRAQQVTLGPVSDEDLTGLLDSILEREERDFGDKQDVIIKKLVQAAYGIPRQAVQMLDLVNTSLLGGGKPSEAIKMAIRTDSVTESFDASLRLIKSALSGDVSGAVKVINSAGTCDGMIELVVRMLSACAFVANGGQPKDGLGWASTKAIGRFDLDAVLALQTRAIAALNIRVSSNYQVPSEALLLSLVRKH